jgi:hypothetical protein
MGRKAHTLSLTQVASYLAYNKEPENEEFLALIASQRRDRDTHRILTEDEWRSVSSFVEGTVRGPVDPDDDWTAPDVPANWPVLRTKLIASGLLPANASLDARLVDWHTVYAYIETRWMEYVDIEWAPRLTTFGRRDSSVVLSVASSGLDGAEQLRKLLAEQGIQPDGNGRFEKRAIEDLASFRRGPKESSRPLNKHFRGKIDEKAVSSAKSYLLANPVDAFAYITREFKAACKAAEEADDLAKDIGDLRAEKATATSNIAKARASSTLMKNDQEMAKWINKRDSHRRNMADAFEQHPGLRGFACVMFGGVDAWRSGDPKKGDTFRKMRGPVIEAAFHALPAAIQRAAASASAGELSVLIANEPALAHLEAWKSTFWEAKAPTWAKILKGLRPKKKLAQKPDNTHTLGR